ncbi:MAG: FG-GAP-like repeat-containing protein [Flavobacteriales bacterium]|nr:FG-GAP-like repeat-containing protein [Flavobacteriales bacterium]
MKSYLVILVMVCSCFSAWGQFAPFEKISPIARRITDAEPVDIDNDGDIDIISTSMIDGAIMWFENDGTGNFPDHHLLASTMRDEKSIAISDLNGDGLLDIVIGRGTNSNSSNRILFNQGQTTFSEVVLPTPAGTNQMSNISCIDMDNDGLQDILLQRDGYWYRNLGSGQFGPVIHLPIEDWNFTMAVDVTGDSLPELFITSSYTWKYLVNEGDGTSFHEVILGSGIAEISGASDLDLDGDIDLLIKKNENGFTLMLWMENDGFGTFIDIHHLAQIENWGFHALSIANVDGQGEPEILNVESPTMIYYLDSLSNLEPDTLFAYGGWGSPVKFADFNGDSILDMLYPMGPVVVFGNGTTHNWEDAICLNTPSYCEFELIDMNRDGFKDIVASSKHPCISAIEVLPYLGNGEYATQVTMVDYKAGNPEPFQLVDYNFDGLPDISYYNWHRNQFFNSINAEGAFAEPELLLEDTFDMAYVAAMEDFDNDGDMDIIRVPIQDMNGEVILYRNNGNGYEPETVGSSYFGIAARAITFDMENDGDMDMAVCMRGEAVPDIIPSGILVLKNDGNGIFERTFIEDGSIWYNNQISYADFDLDGDNDILITYSQSNQNMVAIFENDYGDYVKHVIDQDNSLKPFVSHPMDVDNDGLTDIVCFSHSVTNDGNSGLFWYKNDGNLSFQQPFFQPYTEPYLQAPLSYVVYNTLDLKSHDRDFDGDLDVFLSDQGPAMGAGGIYFLENLFWGSYRITGNLFVDTDADGTLDSTDLPFPFIGVDISPAQSVFYANAAGIYNAITGTGTYTVAPDFDTNLWSLSSPNASYTVTLDSSNMLASDIDFGVVPVGVQPHGNIEIVELAGLCNSPGYMWVSVQNTGNTILSGALELIIDPIIDAQSIVCDADSIVGNHIYFTLDSLYYYDLKQWQIEVELPGTDHIGDVIFSQATYQDVSGLELHEESADILSCAYDPNDKSESTGIGPDGLIEDGQWLEYTVRFQNTGNAAATNVVIRDPLSSYLDRTSLTPISWSHHVQVSVEPDRDAVFRFDNIMLPDSGADYAASQGYIRYRIKADSNLYPGTLILNEAHIIFDNNPPIITNITSNKVDCYELTPQDIVWSGERLRSPFLLPESQQWFLNGNPIPNANGITFEPILDGVYSIDAFYFEDCKVSSTEFVLEQTGIQEGEQNFASIYPNPSKGDFVVQFASIPAPNSSLVVTDVIGRMVYQNNQLSNGIINVPASGLNHGMFLIYLEQEGTHSFLGKLILVGP